jgi:hypothetical protein
MLSMSVIDYSGSIIDDSRVTLQLVASFAIVIKQVPSHFEASMTKYEKSNNIGPRRSGSTSTRKTWHRLKILSCPEVKKSTFSNKFR